MAMIWGDAVLPYRLTMFLGGIALVATPIVLGIFLGKTVHIVVTIGLGKDAGSCYGEILAVALYYCGVGQVVIWLEAIAVYYDCLGTHAKAIEGTVPSPPSLLPRLSSPAFRPVPRSSAAGLVLPSRAHIYNMYALPMPLTQVKESPKIPFFTKKIPEKFACSGKSAYLCIRFRQTPPSGGWRRRHTYDI